MHWCRSGAELLEGRRTWGSWWPRWPIVANVVVQWLTMSLQCALVAEKDSGVLVDHLLTNIAYGPAVCPDGGQGQWLTSSGQMVDQQLIKGGPQANSVHWRPMVPYGHCSVAPLLCTGEDLGLCVKSLWAPLWSGRPRVVPWFFASFPGDSGWG